MSGHGSVIGSSAGSGRPRSMLNTDRASRGTMRTRGRVLTLPTAPSPTTTPGHVSRRPVKAFHPHGQLTFDVAGGGHDEWSGRSRRTEGGDGAVIESALCKDGVVTLKTSRRVGRNVAVADGSIL